MKLERTTAAASQRYSRQKVFSRAHRPVDGQNQLLPTTASSLPSGWKRYIHPEGQPYYHHAERKLLTEANLEQEEVVDSIDRWYSVFQEAAHENPVNYSELVLELNEETLTCKYYLIDHDRQMECWLDLSDTEALAMEMSCNEQHLAIQLQEHYWTHCEYFPNHHVLPVEAEERILAMLCHATTDQLTSEESTAPYTAFECERLIKVIKDFKGCCGEKQFTIARLHRVFIHSHFVNLYGQNGARLARTQSILDERTELPSLLLDAISCSIFFGIPQDHAKALRGLWVDRVVYIEHWRNYLQRLEKEWSRSMTLAGLFLLLNTVIIAVNPKVDYLPYLGIALSLIFSLGAIVSGVTHLYRHQIDLSNNAVSAGLYLESTYHPTLGHRPLSISYSIPLAAASWSIATFSGGLLIHVYAAQEGNQANVLLYVGTAVGATIFWSVFGT